MFKKRYSIVMNSDNTEEAFKEVMMIFSKFGKIEKVKEVKDWNWTIIELKTSLPRWQTLVGTLKRKMDKTPVRLNNMWFI